MFPPQELVEAETDGLEGLTEIVTLEFGVPPAPEMGVHESVKVLSLVRFPDQ